MIFTFSILKFWIHTFFVFLFFSQNQNISPNWMDLVNTPQCASNSVEFQQTPIYLFTHMSQHHIIVLFIFCDHFFYFMFFFFFFFSIFIPTILFISFRITPTTPKIDNSICDALKYHYSVDCAINFVFKIVIILNNVQIVIKSSPHCK